MDCCSWNFSKLRTYFDYTVYDSQKYSECFDLTQMLQIFKSGMLITTPWEYMDVSEAEFVLLLHSEQRMQHNVAHYKRVNRRSKSFTCRRKAFF